MKITADMASLLSSDRSIVVEHGEGSQRRAVTFSLTIYKRGNFSEDNETFKVINDYWASLSERIQSEIYAVYEDIRELFDSVSSNKTLKKELNELVKRLMEYHKTKDVIRWIKGNPLISVPKEVPMTYVYDVDKATTVDKTYVYEDYYGLMSFPLIFRAMIPIWAMYSKTAKSDGGKENKEKESFLLLQGSEVFTSEPFDRLRRYIEANISKDAYTGNHTLAFICSEDMPMYLMSLVCVRKLCLADLYVEQPTQNLVALVYTYFVDRPGPHGNDYSEQVRELKIKSDKGGESEGANSTLEMYKARANITSGRIAEMEYSLRDPVELTLRLWNGNGYRDDVIRDIKNAMETVKIMRYREVKTPQVLLAAWVMAPVFPPQGMFYLDGGVNEHKLMTVQAITETVLRHRGFGYLALLASSVAMTDEEGLRVAQIGSKSQINDDMSAKFVKHFPYRRENKRKASTTSHCFVSEDIKMLTDEFSRYAWRATADEALVRQVFNTHVRRVPILPSLRSDLVAMLVDAEESADF